MSNWSQDERTNMITLISGLQDRMKLLEARVLVQKDDIVRLSNKVSERAAEIHKLDEQNAINIRRIDDLYPYRLDHHLRLLQLEAKVA